MSTILTLTSDFGSSLSSASRLRPASAVAAPARRESIFAIWRGRIARRWELAKLLRNNPELIDDVGLTARQIEAEVAKPFWRR